VLTITGSKLFPGDFANDAVNLATLRVNIGRMPSLCSDPREVAPALPATFKFQLQLAPWLLLEALNQEL